MTKLSYAVTAFFLLGMLSLAAQGDEDRGKSFYDAGKTQLKEVINYREIMDPSDMSVKGYKKHGPYFYYYENGKLKISGQYKNDKKHGDWKYYNQDGTQTKTESYSDGVLK